MRKRNYLGLLAAGALLLGGACSDLTVPDYNNPSLEDLQANPTVSGVKAAATGLLIGTRLDMETYVLRTGIVGREAYFLDPNEPRYVAELVVGPLDPGGFGGALWTFPYRNIRNANVLLGAVEKVTMPNTEKEAIRGFAKTIQALDYLQIINTRDQLGAAIEVNRGVNDPPAPIAGKAEVYNHLVKLLDEAKGHLQAGGGSFPFPLSSGFAGFNSASSFLKFNRALKARAEVYRKNYPAALAALQESFVTTGGSVDPISNRALLNLGVYHTYSGRSGDDGNSLADASGRLVAVPSLRTAAELRPSGQRDARFVLKTDSLAKTSSQGGASSNLKFAIYTGIGTPIPIIRNEELILLRAEARYFTGDKAGALADVNFIRVNSGGLAPRGPFTSDDDFVTELLKQRRYSLLFEGGHRWLDARRFGRLESLREPGRSGDVIPNAFPIPTAEQQARQ